MAKGFTAEEIVGRFTGGVTGAGSKWEERTLAGAGRYADWIGTWLPGLYALLPAVYRMPDVYARVKRVCEYTKGKAKTYQADKIRKLTTVIAPKASPATPA